MADKEFFGSAASDSKVKIGEQKRVLDTPKTSFAPIAARNKLFSTTMANDIDILKARPRLAAADLMRIYIATKTPVTLWGPVGSRKTRTVEALAQEVDEFGTHYKVQTIQPSTEDPTTIHGLMFTEFDHTTGITSTKRAIPQVAQDVLDYYMEFKGLTIQFMDEMTTCMPAVQNALLGLLTHGKYGEADLSQYRTSVMAANPQGTVEFAYELSTAVINRGGHIPWYGDKELFLDDWSDGFGREELKPPEDVEWFIRELLEKDPDYVFRDQYRDGGEQRWTIDTLCPYDQMQCSERAITELAKMYGHIDRIFAQDPAEIHDFFIVEITRSMLGNRWAHHAELVCATANERLTPKKSIDLVRKNGVQLTDTIQVLRNKIGSELHMKNHKKLTPDQEETLIGMILGEVIRDNIFSMNAYVAAWAFISTVDPKLYPMMVNPIMTLMFFALKQQQNDGQTWKSKPEFVPDELSCLLTDALNNIKSEGKEIPLSMNIGGQVVNLNTLSMNSQKTAPTLDTEMYDIEMSDKYAPDDPTPYE